MRYLLDEIQRRISACLFFMCAPRRDPRVRRLGSEYGGWHIPLDELSAGSIVYSAGVGEDITFDLALIRELGCIVHAFDPTPRACEFVQHHSNLPKQFIFHPIGIWNEEGTARFYAPRDPKHVSHSIGNIQRTGQFFTAEVHRLGSIMRELKHPRIDLLKMDIEGAECEVLLDTLHAGIRPATLCVEFDKPSVAANMQALGALRRAGYRAICAERRNMTFVLRR